MKDTSFPWSQSRAQGTSSPSQRRESDQEKELDPISARRRWPLFGWSKGGLECYNRAALIGGTHTATRPIGWKFTKFTEAKATSSQFTVCRIQNVSIAQTCLLQISQILLYDIAPLAPPIPMAVFLPRPPYVPNCSCPPSSLTMLHTVL